MSRRKQGSKPQHRSELSREGVELDEASGHKAAMPPQPDLRNRDLLTCGQCDRSFLLCNILGFIEHKKSRCDRPSRLRDSRGGPRSPRAAADPLAAIEDGPTASVSEIAAEDDPEGDEMEPAYYICTSCKEPFSSAWFLLHHAQYTHGLHIYLELDDSDSLSAPRMGVSPSTSAERPPQPSPTSILDGSPFEGPQCPEPSFRGRSPAASMLFTPPLRCPPDYSDSGSEEAGGTTASRHTSAERTFPLRVPSAAQKEMDFSRRLRRLAGDARRPFPASSPFLSAPSPPQAPSAGSARQRSPHGRSKECEFCGKSFKFPSNLVVHRRSHTGEKPYRCPFCDHACSQSSKLKRHMKTHMHHAALFNGWPPAERLVGGIKEEPPAAGYRHRAHSAAGRENGAWQDAGECGRPQGQSRGFSVHSVGSLLGEQEELGLKIKILKEEPEDPQLGEQKGQSDCEGNGPLSDSEHFHTEEEFAIGESEGAAASPPTGLANGFGFHSKRPLGPPLGPSLLRAPHKPVKAEEDVLEEEEASRNYYSRWLADCAASRQQPLAPPPAAAARASPSSENSGENAGSRSSTPPRDISADSGTASGHSTPKRMGGAGRGVAGDGRRRNTCEFCGKVFRNASNLTVHRRSHTGERPYRCELCSYACTQSSKLTRHMKTHMQPGKEVFRCNSCNIPFSIYSTLEKHMKKRHSESLREPQLSN